eukprot:scaffold42471_cov57-Phaeocystis_antarctica.AAC.1
MHVEIGEEAAEEMHVEPEGWEAPSAAALAVSAAPRVSSAEHAQLVQRLEVHRAAHGLSQKQMASAAGLSCASKLSLWIGRNTAASLPAATMVETDARIAAYLDRAPIPPLTRLELKELGSAVASAASAAASAASAVAPHISAERAQLVQRLEEHMAAHDLSQGQVAKAANLTSTGKLGLWLGRSAQTLAVASMLETDTRIA